MTIYCVDITPMLKDIKSIYKMDPDLHKAVVGKKVCIICKVLRYAEHS